MHSAIFVAKIPPEKADWDDFIGQVRAKVRDAANVEPLAENVWQVNFQAAPAALAWLIVLCDQRGIAYEILPLGDAPQWLPVATNRRTS